MRKIFISAGHSNTSPGAVGNGFTEAQIVTEFRNLVLTNLRLAGRNNVTSDGFGNDNLPLSEVVKLFKSSDVAVEFHVNSFKLASATGVETLSAPKDFPLGKALCAVTAKTLGIANRGAKPENSGQHSRLGFVKSGGLILELFFLSNKHDLESYLANKEKLAKEVAKVLLEAAK